MPWAPTVIVTVPGVVVFGRKSAPAMPFTLVVTLVNTPTGLPSAVVAWKVTTVPSVTIPWSRSRVAVTWILVLAAAVAIGGSAAAVITVGRARTNWIATSRVTPLTVAETRAVVIVFGLIRSAEARPPASAATWTVGAPPGAKVPAVVEKVTWREPAGSDEEMATVKVVAVAPSAGAWGGAVTKRIVSSAPAGVKVTVSEARMPGAAAGVAVTVAEPTCCEATRSICAMPLPSACTVRQPVQPVPGVPPSSVPLVVEKTTVRLANAGSPGRRAWRWRREKPSAGSVVTPLVELRVMTSLASGAVGE